MSSSEDGVALQEPEARFKRHDLRVDSCKSYRQHIHELQTDKKKEEGRNALESNECPFPGNLYISTVVPWPLSAWYQFLAWSGGTRRSASPTRRSDGTLTFATFADGEREWRCS